MRKVLAIDAGGTSTRAAVIDLHGHCLGYGRAGSGNVLAAGFEAAIDAMASAAALAAAADESDTDARSSALIALAGSEAPPYQERAAERFAVLGYGGGVALESDLLGTYFSGTASPDGCGLIAGTGTVACRVSEGAIVRTSGGNGWLLGDAGSGFWLGHQAARAVVSDLDDAGEPTALTAAVLADVGLVDDGSRVRGRPKVVNELIDVLHRGRPAELSRFAPLVLRLAATDDPVASALVAEAADALGTLLRTVQDDRNPGPSVAGGGLLSVPSALTARLAEVNPEVIVVPDGVVGAALLGLRRAGIPLDAPLFERVRTSVQECVARTWQAREAGGAA